MSDNSKTILMLLDNPLRADARVEKEAAALTAAGFTVKILAMEDPTLPFYEERSFGNIYRLIPSCINKPFSNEYVQFRKNFTGTLAHEDYQVIHCHDFATLPLAMDVKKVKHEVKVVYDSHEYLAGWPFYKDLHGLINRLKGHAVWKYFVLNEKTAAPQATHIITVSESIASEMRREFKLKNTPLVIRNIPERAPISEEKYFHRKYALPSQARIIVHSGNPYHSAERMNMLVNVVSAFNDLYLVFIGAPEKFRKFGDKLTSERVLFHDYMERSVLNNLISSADFGIVHTWQPDWKSHWLSLPNRIMEYSVAALPVIATSQPEFVRLGKEFGHMVFYHGDDRESLQKAISEALEKYSMLKSAALRARESLSWEEESNKLVNLYRELL